MREGFSEERTLDLIRRRQPCKDLVQNCPWQQEQQMQRSCDGNEVDVFRTQNEDQHGRGGRDKVGSGRGRDQRGR